MRTFYSLLSFNIFFGGAAFCGNPNWGNQKWRQKWLIEKRRERQSCLATPSCIMTQTVALKRLISHVYQPLVFHQTVENLWKHRDFMGFRHFKSSFNHLNPVRLECIHRYPSLHPFMACPVQNGPLQRMSASSVELHRGANRASELRTAESIWKIRRKWQVGMGQNPVPLVNIKIAGKWMFIPLKNGINRYWSIPRWFWSQIIQFLLFCWCQHHPYEFLRMICVKITRFFFKPGSLWECAFW